MTAASLLRYLLVFLGLVTVPHLLAILLPLMEGDISFADVSMDTLSVFLFQRRLFDPAIIIAGIAIGVDCAFRHVRFSRYLSLLFVFLIMAILFTVAVGKGDFGFSLTRYYPLDYSILICSTVLPASGFIYAMVRLYFRTGDVQ